MYAVPFPPTWRRKRYGVPDKGVEMKNWVVTGSSRGIGLGFVKELLAKEQKVFAVTRNPSAELKNFSENKHLSIINCDLSKEGQENEVVEALKGQPVDYLINNAGVMLDAGKGFEDLPLKDLRKTMDVNLEVPMRLTKALLPLLKKSAQPRVAHISSQMGSIEDNTSGGYYAYRISKAALNMFNKSFSVDYPMINSVVLHPGWVQTDMGGPNAQITVEESVSGLLKVIEDMNKEKSGKFINYKGDEIPW